MRGVVACEALYSLIQRFIPTSKAPIRYIPAELHEFPVNVPLDTAIGDRVQAAIDAIDNPDLEAVVLSYANAGSGLDGVATRHAPLIVSREADCTATVLPSELNELGERKATGTLYLTRGWIDCGVDSYKLYKAYQGETEDLIEHFRDFGSTEPGIRVTWHEGDRFRRAADRPRPVATDALDRFFYSVVGYYDRVVLVDTGDLCRLHHTYAERVRAFIDRLRRRFEPDADVEFRIVHGRTDRLESLLSGAVTGSAFADVYEPGQPIGRPRTDG